MKRTTIVLRCLFGSQPPSRAALGSPQHRCAPLFERICEEGGPTSFIRTISFVFALLFSCVIVNGQVDSTSPPVAIYKNLTPCNQATTLCNLIPNPSFEFANPLNLCGDANLYQVDCWTGSSDFFSGNINCNSQNPYFSTLTNRWDSYFPPQTVQPSSSPTGNLNFIGIKNDPLLSNPSLNQTGAENVVTKITLPSSTSTLTYSLKGIAYRSPLYPTVSQNVRLRFFECDNQNSTNRRLIQDILIPVGNWVNFTSIPFNFTKVDAQGSVYIEFEVKCDNPNLGTYVLLDNLSLGLHQLTLNSSSTCHGSILDLNTLLNTTAYQGTFSGPGVSGTTFNSNLVSPGTHTISYTYSCGNSSPTTRTATITVQPKVSTQSRLLSYDPITRTFNFEMTALNTGPSRISSFETVLPQGFGTQGTWASATCLPGSIIQFDPFGYVSFSANLNGGTALSPGVTNIRFSATLRQGEALPTSNVCFSPANSENCEETGPCIDLPCIGANLPTYFIGQRGGAPTNISSVPSITTQSTSGKCFYVEGELVININRLFLNCEFIMGPNSKITVQAGKLFGLYQGTIVRACTDMWQGIEVKSGARLIANSNIGSNNTLIQDALTAVLARHNAEIVIQRITMSNNKVGISLKDNFQSSGRWNYNLAPASKIESNVFKAVGRLIGPNSSQKAQMGIEAADFNTISLPIRNTFDNLEGGIAVWNTTLNITDQQFLNIRKLNDPNNGGFAVHFYSDGNASYSLSGIRKCVFNNCNTGVKVGRGNATLKEATFDRCNTGVWVELGEKRTIEIGGASTDGLNMTNMNQRGIMCFSNSNCERLDIVNNSIRFTTNPVSSGNAGIVLSGNTMLGNLGNPTVQGNTLFMNGAAATGIQLTSQTRANVIGNAVNLLQSHRGQIGVGLSAAPVSGIFGNVVTGNGTIGGSMGIRTELSQSSNIQCNTTKNLQTGLIFMQDCDQTAIQGNVMNNNAIGLHLTSTAKVGAQGTQTTGKGQRWQSMGSTAIHAKSDVPANLTLPIHYELPNANTPNLAGFSFPQRIEIRGQLFAGANLNDPGQRWYVPANTDEFACRTQKSEAYIGDQLSEDDYIVAQQTLDYPEFDENLDWSDRRTLYRKLTSYPALQQQSTVMSDFYAAMQGTSIALLENLDIQTEAVMTWSATDKLALQVLETNIGNWQSTIDQLNAQAAATPPTDSLALATWNTDMEYALAQLVLANEQYISAYQGMKAPKLNSLELLLDENDNITGTAIYEEYTTLYNEIYLGTIAPGQDTLSEDQKATLTAMSETCPLIGGPTVFKARALRNLYDPKFQYDDNMACSGWGVQWLTQRPSASTDPNAEQMKHGFGMYPNPATDFVTLTWKAQQTGEGQVLVTDALGKVVITQRLYMESGVQEISASHLSRGVYYLKVENPNGETVFQQKLVIIND